MAQIEPMGLKLPLNYVRIPLNVQSYCSILTLERALTMSNLPWDAQFPRSEQLTSLCRVGETTHMLNRQTENASVVSLKQKQITHNTTHNSMRHIHTQHTQ
jgi:hypothetical protein